MKVKAFEIRDKGTFIPAIAIEMRPPPPAGLPPVHCEIAEKERYLLRRAGFDFECPSVVLLKMECKGGPREASYDKYSWGPARTMTVAHDYIEAHWNELKSGDVICVEHILGERPAPKVSERLDHEGSKDHRH